MGRQKKRLIRQAQEIAFFPENRKKYTFQLFFYYSKVIKRLETIFGISYENLKYLFTEELEDLEKNADELASLSEKRKKEGFLIYVNNLGIKILDKVKERILEAEIQDQAQDEKIEGFVAFKGKKKKYKGKVNVVIVPKDGKDFKKGDFLVTAMTSPDFIHYIKKAGAIITNEGGITSHAAIIARELEKPCIIGTKIATQVLKDGDLVELDMEKGTVKILEKI